MVATPSTMVELGSVMQDFELIDAVSGRLVRSSDIGGGAPIVVAFVCNHCPYVKHIRQKFAELGNECTGRGVSFFAISSNDVESYPADSPERMAEEASDAGYVFPYLYDSTQEVAIRFNAACTPDFFVFDRDRKLAYRGQFDASRPGNGVAVTGADLRAAIDAVLVGERPSARQTPSLGCNIKWKPGNEP